MDDDDNNDNGSKGEKEVPVSFSDAAIAAVAPKKTHEIPFGVARITAELKDFYKGYHMTGGDFGSLTQLFFDNLSTLLGALYAVQNMSLFQGVPVPRSDIDQVVWGKIVPGVGMTLFLGNVYYSWMAVRLANRWERPYTAQPYGLNTPQAFAFVFNVMYPVYFKLVGTEGPSAAFSTAYKVALVANFITGMILTTLACFGPLILKVVPPAALLVPIAGIGIAFLGLEQLTNSIAAPIVGYYATIWLFLGWYARVRVGYGNYRCPEALQVILVGVILGWSTGLNTTAEVRDAATWVRWWGPNLSLNELFSDFSLIKDYLGIVIPIAISAAATTLMCLVSAKNAGDPFPVRESMLCDGIGTMLSSCFGSPFGTVIYIGHPAHKRSGALVGYSMTNGFVYLLLSWFGVLALVQSVVNQACIGPIVLFVGLMVNEEALGFMPHRHYAAYIIGLFPSIYDWTVNVSGTSPMLDQVTGGDSNYPGLTQWYGVLAWKRGALLVSFLWVAMIVMVIDRQWKKATIWALIAAFFALFGIIHVPAAGFKNFSSPTWEQCTVYPTDCWTQAEQWKFFVAYLMMAATFAMIAISYATGFDKALLPPVDDETAHAFNNWFEEAATVRKHPGEEDFYDESTQKDVSRKTVRMTSDAFDPEEAAVPEAEDASVVSGDEAVA